MADSNEDDVLRAMMADLSNDRLDALPLQGARHDTRAQATNPLDVVRSRGGENTPLNYISAQWKGESVAECLGLSLTVYSCHCIRKV